MTCEKFPSMYMCRCYFKNSNEELLMPMCKSTGETILQSLYIAYQFINEHVQKKFQQGLLESPVGTITYTLSMNVYLFDDRTDTKYDHLNEYEKTIYKPCFFIKFEGKTIDDVLFKLWCYIHQKINSGEPL